MKHGSEVAISHLCVDYPIPFTLFRKQRRSRQVKEGSQGKFRALKDITLSVGSGERIGVVGLNGAGKTTLFRTIAGVLYPARGSVVIDSIPAASPNRPPIGYLAAQPLIYRRLSAYENLKFIANLYHIPNANDRIEEVITMVGLQDHLDEYVEQYSTGMRARLDLARVFLPDPPLLLLDEPFSSFDVHYADIARNIIASSKATVLLATHDVEEIERMTNRLILIHHGRLMRDIIFDDLSAVGPTGKDKSVLTITEFVHGLLSSTGEKDRHIKKRHELPA